MVFSSAIFLFVFLPAVIAVYYALDSRLKNPWLLAASLFFYSWGEPRNVLVMLISIVANYALARALGALRSRGRGAAAQNVALVTAVALNLGMLFYFKYTDFFIKNANRLFGCDIPLLHIALPIGISFFTFQSLSYIVDVRLGKVPVQKSVLDLGLYISFFPQLIAGPIVRYIDVERQIRSRTVDAQKFHDGCIRFAAGFAKKVLIADQLAPYVDTIFARNGMNAPLAVFGAVAYALQIYFDFSGYSDMAIGLGKMFGFDFMENFNCPYTSRSVKEFWRRWHLSLSQWFRDYVYIPLGGSRCSMARSCVNLAVVFLLTGFWHGASWTFVCWGLYYAGFLILERLWWGNVLERLPSAVRRIYTLTVVCFGWVLFRTDGIRRAIRYVRSLFLLTPDMRIDIICTIDRKAVFFVLAGILFSLPVGRILQEKCAGRLRVVYDLFVLGIFVVAIAFLLGTGFSPFLYFRF